MKYLIALGFVLLVSIAYAGLSGAPWVPTWRRDIRRILKLSNLKKGEKFYELGCGDARICTSIAKQSEADTVGVELSLLQYFVAKLRSSLIPRSSIRFGNAFKTDISDADVVYMFLMPETYEKIRPKLESELKSGARVITYVWPIPGWSAEEIDQSEGSPKLYLYTR